VSTPSHSSNRFLSVLPFNLQFHGHPHLIHVTLFSSALPPCALDDRARRRRPSPSLEAGRPLEEVAVSRSRVMSICIPSPVSPSPGTLGASRGRSPSYRTPAVVHRRRPRFGHLRPYLSFVSTHPRSPRSPLSVPRLSQAPSRPEPWQHRHQR
jgi:hypothetical protein